jgi:hypothetical protein
MGKDSLFWRANFWRSKAVSCAAHGPQVNGLFRIHLNPGPQFSYIHVHGARTHERGVFPDRIKNLVAGKNAAGVAENEKRPGSGEG